MAEGPARSAARRLTAPRSCCAHRGCPSNDVSILARGARLAEIRDCGIRLEDGVTGQRTTTRVEVVEHLAPDEAYDVVMVILPRDRVAEVLPILAVHEHTPSVVFLATFAT